MLDGAYLLLQVSPLQCLNSPIMIRSPFPSHPTGRSVFPNPAVRQSSSHSMRRLSCVLDDSAPDIDDSPGIQSRIRIVLPSEASTFMTIVQVTPKASVDKALQASKRIACIGVAEVVHPSPHRLIHLFNKLCGRNRCPPLGEVLDPSADIALCAPAGKDVDAPLAAFGRAALRELKPDEVESLD